MSAPRAQLRRLLLSCPPDLITTTITGLAPLLETTRLHRRNAQTTELEAAKKKPPIMQEQESLSGDDTMSLLTRSELLLLTGEPVSPSEVLKLWQAGQSATHPVTLSCTI